MMRQAAEIEERIVKPMRRAVAFGKAESGIWPPSNIIKWLVYSGKSYDCG